MLRDWPMTNNDKILSMIRFLSNLFSNSIQTILYYRNHFFNSSLDSKIIEFNSLLKNVKYGEREDRERNKKKERKKKKE